MNTSSKAEPVSADIKATHLVQQWKHEAPLINCRFDPSGRYVFAAAEDAKLVRWDMATGNKVVLTGHDTWARGITFTPDGKTMITGGYDDQLIWWPVEGDGPQPMRKVKAHKGWIRAVDMSPDGKQLASAGNDKVVKLWDADTGALLHALSGHEKDVYSVLFHPGGQFLLSGDLKGQVIQWDLGSGKQVRTFDGKALYTYNAGQRVDYGGVRSLALSPDGKQLTAAGLHKATNPLGAVNEPLVLRFDWESQKSVLSHIATGVKGVAWRALFHANGTLIAASGGSGGGFLLFWDAKQDKELHKFKLPNTAREMDLHPDGLQVATAHHDGQLRISRMMPKPAVAAKKG